jgi:hypothetical protein
MMWLKNSPAFVLAAVESGAHRRQIPKVLAEFGLAVLGTTMARLYPLTTSRDPSQQLHSMRPSDIFPFLLTVSAKALAGLINILNW